MARNPSLNTLKRLLDEAIACVPDEIEDRDLDPRLHGYQRTAVHHLHANARAGLFLDMGLGKTFSVLAALQPEHLPALVIAPKRVTEKVWPAEVPKWRPDLSLAVAAYSPAKRAAALASGADIVVISRDNMKDVPANHGFRTIVLDELSSWKNRGTQRWKHAKMITRAVPYVWGLTGTPTPNGLIELWPQMYILDKGQRLGTTLTGYRQRYFTEGRRIANGTVVEWDLQPDAEERILNRIGDICLSMKSEGLIDIPPVTFNDVAVELPPATMKIYNQMQKDLVAEVGDGKVTAMNAAGVTGKLSQISAGFIYDENGDATWLHDEKIKAVQEIIDGTGSPVLLFYRFRAERDALVKAIDGVRTIDEKGVLDEWDEGKVPVLLAHPASAGHGLNMQTGGHTIIWSSLTWSPEEYAQANARVARQGQEHPVVIHRLLAASVDAAQVARQEGKASAQDAVMRALGLASE